MFSFIFVFWMFIVLFGLVGALRGWGKELLVSFSIIISLFVIQVIQAYLTPLANFLASSNPKTQFYVWGSLVTSFALFGYHTPNLHRIVGVKLERKRLQDILTGAFLGVCNGYLLIGTLWFYLDIAGYPFTTYMSAPQPGTMGGDAALKLLPLLPPVWLGVPAIYFAVAIAFTFVVTVFI